MQATVSPSTLANLLRVFIPAKMATLITGRPGIGKSEIIFQACEELGYDVILAHPVVDDPTDYKGLPFAGDGVADFMPFGNLHKLMNADRPTAFVLDDLGQASPSVQAAAMQLLLAREINGNKVSDYVSFVAATNRREDNAGVSGLLSPLKGRFNILELDSTIKDWSNWALNQSHIPVELIAACRMKPDWIEQWSPSKDIINTPNPRNVGEVGKMMAFPLGRAERFAAFASRMGSAAASELNSILNLYEELPDVDGIIRSPLTAKLVNDPSVMYLLIGALVSKTELANFDNVVTYVERLPDDFGMVYFQDIALRKKEVLTSKKYIRWAIANQKYVQ